MYTKYISILFLAILPFCSVAQIKDLPTILKEAESAKPTSPGAELVNWLRVYDAAQEEDPAYLPKACIAIGNLYKREELHEQALSYYLEAYDVLSFEEVEGQSIDDLHKILGGSYAALGNIDSTYLFYNKVLSKVQKEDNTVNHINTLQEMITVFTELKDFRKTLDFNLAINELLKKEKDSQDALMRNYNNLGYNYNQLENYEKAIFYFENALELSKESDLESRSVLQTNIGIAYFNLEEFSKSIKFLRKARKNKLEIDPEGGAVEIEHLMTSVFLKQKDLTNAMNFSKSSERNAKTFHEDLILTDIYYTSALIHSELYEYDVALEFFQKHLRLKDSFALVERFRQQEIQQQQIELERTEKQLKIFMINEEVQELTINQLTVERENQELALRAQKAQIEAEKTEKELLQKENGLKASQLKTQELETEKTRQALELARQKLIASQKDKELNSLEREKEVQALELATSAAKLENEKRAKELLESDKKLLQRENEVNELALSQQKQRTQFLFGLGGLMTLLMILAGIAWLNSRRLNARLNKQNKDIEAQKEEITLARNKSDQLLLNILPEETAHELKENGFAIPKNYDNATVLFTDFVGFTTIASRMSPEELIKELNICFQAFDAILEDHGMEKIKTIGDAYMCVSGVPVPNEDHSIQAIQAGKEIVAFMNNRIKQKKKEGVPYWNMRMGIHSGSVVAGVVGKKKFAYDIWGDTVNTASRMEANGEPGQINISETTYELVKGQFKCESRGKIMAKNIGEVGMYFVE